MSTLRLPKADKAKELSVVAQEKRKQQEKALQEIKRQERLALRRMRIIQKKHAESIKTERNKYIKAAILEAGSGKCFVEVPELDEEVVIAIERAGFKVEKKSDLRKFLSSDIHDFYQNDLREYINQADYLKIFEDFMSGFIASRSAPNFSNEKIDELVEILLLEYKVDWKRLNVQTIRERIKKLSLLVDSKTLLNPLDVILNSLRRHHFTFTIESEHLQLMKFDADSLEKIALISKRLIHEYEKEFGLGGSFSIRRNVIMDVADILKKNYRTIKQNNSLLTWYRSKYFPESADNTFASGLFWLSVAYGQLAVEGVTAKILDAVEHGEGRLLYTLQTKYEPRIDDFNSANALKHFLRLNGYSVNVIKEEGKNFEFDIRWA